MDLNEWEFLDDGGFLDFHDATPLPHLPTSHPTTEFDMNYFTCPSTNSTKIIQPNQLAHVQLHLDKIKIIAPTPYDDDLAVIEAVDSKIRPPDIGSDQDSVTQVFFPKSRENEFVDMKLDSPKSEAEEILNSPRLRMGLKKSMEMEFHAQKEVPWEEDDGGLKIWKWGLSGIGAICSFGIICVIVFGSHHGHKHPQHLHKLRFQIYSHDKRSKMDEAISAVRGVHLSSTGGHLEAL